MKSIYFAVTVLGGLLMLAGLYALSPGLAMIVGGLSLYVVGWHGWKEATTRKTTTHEAAADRLIDEVQRERPFRPIVEP